jgi:outer membrane immunogenic protein
MSLAFSTGLFVSRFLGIFMNRYQRLGMALIVLGSGIDGAMAADMPVKAPPMMPEPVSTWTGFYVGGNAGYGWDTIKSSEVSGTGAFPVGTVFSTENGSGWLAGAQVGYNMQVAPNFVVGVEAEYSWADISGSETTVSTVPRLLGFTSTSTTKLRDFALGTARIGYATPSYLLYLKGGVAYGESTGSGIATNANGTLFETSNHFSSRTGAVVGVGAEWMFAPNWSARIEYDHIFFDSRLVAISGTVDTSISSSGNNVDMVRAGVNYHFNWGMPVVAKY